MTDRERWGAARSLDDLRVMVLEALFALENPPKGMSYLDGYVVGLVDGKAEAYNTVLRWVQQ